MRWVKRILVFILALVVMAGVWGFLMVRASFPQLNGELEVSALDTEVTVRRDQYGVPHIYAANTADLFRAQGYVEAQDRFFQMDFWRHIGSARLSEMFGDSQLETDMFLRSLGFEALARSELEMMPERSREILEWYAEGVNAYLEDHQGSSLSLEYLILPLQSPGYEPELWEPVDTLTWAKVMSWDLSGNFRTEITRTVLAETLEAGQIDQLYPPYPANHPLVAPQGIRSTGSAISGSVPDGAVAALESVRTGQDLVDGLTGGGFEGIGSNNWVVDGSLTDTGMPILANDPHLAIQMPSIWYEVGLHCSPVGTACPFDVVGFSFPGTPAVVIGHNSRIAWGVTTQATDTQDLYIERINPDDPNQYEVDGEWVDMEVRTEVIEVAGGDPVEHQVRATRHGPIISGIFGPLDAIDGGEAGYPEEYAVSLAWQSLEPSTLVEAIIELNLASDWEEFRAALSSWDIAAQNVVYADVDGNIGYQATGEIPIRASGNGMSPVEGWVSDNDWVGVVPFEELPFIFNPERGYVVTANQPVLEPGALPFFGVEGAYGYRASRIEEMILTSDVHTVARTQAMQMDTRNGGAVALVPALIGVESRIPEVVVMQDLIEDWSLGLDGLRSGPDSAGAAAYEATWRHLLRLTFHDDLPEDDWPEGGSRWFQVVDLLLDVYGDPFWDDRDTPVTETASSILERALADGYAELSGLLGADTSEWRWGDLHIATFENQSLGQSGIAPVEWLFNRTAPRDVGGGSSIVNAVGWTPPEGYVVDWVPSMRMVIDLADLDNSTSVHTTGQSGHAFHGNYADMISLWVDGDQHPMLWSTARVEAGAVNTLVLTPEG